MKKRILALVLTLSMALAAFPGAALASEPTGARDIAEIMSQITEIPSWWWAAGLTEHGTVLSETTKQNYVNWVISEVAADPGNSNTLANAINGLCALGYDPTDLTAADGTKYNAVELLKSVDAEAEKKGSWQWHSVPGYVLLACNQGDWGTEALEQTIVDFLIESAEEKGGWSTQWGPDSTGMTLQGLSRYYDTNEDVRAVVDAALARLSKIEGCWGNPSSDAMVALALASLNRDTTAMEAHLVTHFDADTHFGDPYTDSQAFAAMAVLGRENGGALFDFRATDRAPALADFHDLPSDHWAWADVRWTRIQGLMNGVGGGAFAPTRTMTRAEAVTLLWRLAGEPEATAQADFTDVAADSWCAAAVSWACGSGIALGKEDGSFGCADPISREELAVLLYRYAQSLGLGFQGMWAFRLDYPDVADISDGSYESLCWLTMHKVLRGDETGRLNPKGTTTRAEMATLLHRFETVLKEA